MALRSTALRFKRTTEYFAFRTETLFFFKLWHFSSSGGLTAFHQAQDLSALLPGSFSLILSGFAGWRSPRRKNEDADHFTSGFCDSPHQMMCVLFRGAESPQKFSNFLPGQASFISGLVLQHQTSYFCPSKGIWQWRFHFPERNLPSSLSCFVQSTLSGSGGK